MAQTLQQRVLDLLAETIDSGDIALSSDMVDTYCTEAVRDIANRVPLPLLSTMITATSEMTANPITVTTEKLVRVLREDGSDEQWRQCQEVPPARSVDILDSGSLFYATKYSPKFYRANGKLYIAPTPTTGGADAAKAEILHLPEVASSASAIDKFPNELEPQVVNYAATRALTREVSEARRSLFDEIEDVQWTLDSIESLLPTYASVTTPSMPTLSLSSMGTLPTLSLSAMGTLPDLTLSSMGTLPSLTLSSFTWSSTEIDDALTQAKELVDTTANINVETRLTDDDLELAQGAVQAANQEISRASTAINEQLGEVQDFQAQTQSEIQEFQSKVDRYIAEFQALTQSEIQEYSETTAQEIQEYQSLTQTEIQEYQAKTQQVIQEYQAKTGTELQEFQSKIQKEIQEYQALVDGETQEFNAKLSKARSHLEEAQVRIQNASGYSQISQEARQAAQELRTIYEESLNRYIEARV